jgi:hypothetical protein
MAGQRLIYVYAWKDSQDVAERIMAYSHRQADFRLGQIRGRSWADDALETGLLYLLKTEAAPPKRARDVRPWYAKVAAKHSDELVQSMPWNQ